MMIIIILITKMMIMIIIIIIVIIIIIIIIISICIEYIQWFCALYNIFIKNSIIIEKTPIEVNA